MFRIVKNYAKPSEEIYFKYTKRNIQNIFSRVCKIFLCYSKIHCVFFVGKTGLPRVREKSGKNKIFSRSGNCQGILKKCQGILAI